MATGAASEVVTVAGRDVPISNPQKILFPQAGCTKLDVVRYYLAVAEGALRGAGDRPNVLVRHPNGIAEFFYQKRAPASWPPWIDVVALKCPSGRSTEEVVPRDAAALAWIERRRRQYVSCSPRHDERSNTLGADDVPSGTGWRLMSTTSVPALLRQQVDRWAETWLKAKFSRLLELRRRIN